MSKYTTGKIAKLCGVSVRKEAIWANHTPTLRKLTCTCCGYKGFCVETYGKEEKK